MANALNTVSRSDINEALAYFRDREEHILSSITVERPDNDTTHVLDNCIVVSDLPATDHDFERLIVFVSQLMGGLPISSPNTHPVFTKFLLQRIANIEPNEHDVDSCYQPLNDDGTSKGYVHGFERQ